MTLRLPLEILHDIVGAVVAGNDRSTILSCSLVCREIRYRCQGHLFHTCQLKFPFINNKTGRLAPILEANKDLTQCINDISFTIDLIKNNVNVIPQGAFEDDEFDDWFDDGPRDWSEDEFEELFRLFDALAPSHIQRLSFTVLWGLFSPLPDIFASRIQKFTLATSPSLQVFETIHRPFPLNFLRALPSLKTLKLGGEKILSDIQEQVAWPGLWSGGERTLPNNPLRVQHLDVSGCSARDLANQEALGGSETILDYNSIKKCTINVGMFESIPMTRGILSRMTGLVSLSLAIHYQDVRDLLPALQDHICSTLQILEASLVFVGSEDVRSDLFLGLFRLLAEFPKPSALTSLDVKVKISYEFTPESALQLFNREDWEMPGVVLNASAFPCLRRVRLRYSTVDFSKSRYGSVFVEQLRSGSFTGLRAWIPDVSCVVSYTVTEDWTGALVVEDYIVE